MAQVVTPGASAAGGAAAPCTAFGTTAGTCAQGNDSRFSAPTITGGTINGAIIGASNPAAIKATTIWQASRNAYVSFAGFAPTGTSSATKVQMGLGSSWVLTPSFSGRVSIRVTGWTSNSLLGNSLINASYGTGTAPANGVAATGTAFNSTDIIATSQSSGANAAIPFTFESEASGLSTGTAYWFDMEVGSSSGSSGIHVVSVVIQEF